MASTTSEPPTSKEEAFRHVSAIKKLASKVLEPQGLDFFERRSSDVIVTAFSKSGSALFSQMCYQIAVASGGHCQKDPTGLEFGELVEVVPWIENMKLLNLGPCETKPRIFKTHMTLSYFEPLKCKHIIPARNPESIPGSMLNFLFDIVVQDTSVTDEVRQECVNLIMENFVLGVPPNRTDGLSVWHSQLKEALESENDNVLVLFYEEVIRNMKPAILAVSRFMGCKLSEEGISTVLDRCNREYMAADAKFKGSREQVAFGLSAAPNLTQPEHLVGFKKFKINKSSKSKLEEMNLRAFGVRTYEEIVNKFSNKGMNGVADNDPHGCCS